MLLYTTGCLGLMSLLCSGVVAVVVVGEAIAVDLVAFLVVFCSMSGIGFCHEVREENTRRQRERLCAALKSQQLLEEQEAIVHTTGGAPTYTYMVCGCDYELNRVPSEQDTGKISSRHAPRTLSEPPLVVPSSSSRPTHHTRCCWRTVACMIANDSHTDHLNSRRSDSRALSEALFHRRKCANSSAPVTQSLLKANRKSVTSTSKLKKRSKKHPRISATTTNILLPTTTQLLSTCLTLTGKSPTSSIGTRCRNCLRR